jgi:hypothetical protein
MGSRPFCFVGFKDDQDLEKRIENGGYNNFGSKVGGSLPLGAKDNNLVGFKIEDHDGKVGISITKLTNSISCSQARRLRVKVVLFHVLISLPQVPGRLW